MKMATTREIMYEERKQFITGTVRETLTVIPDFGGIQYVRELSTDQEYVKIYDIIGGVIFLNVTAVPLDIVLMDIARVILGRTPQSIITDTGTKREVARLFVK